RQAVWPFDRAHDEQQRQERGPHGLQDLIAVVSTELEGCDDLLNTAIGIFEDAGGQISIIRYGIPYLKGPR
ncbi:hypothetical protein, partial [Cupriavidus sp. CuC1]|uniref:hypothetical protein n=1 Tax=Cupriavidus sp. CuC1 TaxID=3373131 RepID=UPI0037CFCF53